MRLLLVVLIVVAVVLVIRALRRRDEKAAPAAAVDPLRRDSRGVDPRALKVGDIVNHDGRDFVVRGTLAFEEDGFRWTEHLIDDANGRRWLSVEDDEELELALWDRVAGTDLVPGASTLDHGGTTYALEEHGHATYRASGTTGTPESGRAEYYDYAAGDRRLSFERYTGDTWEVSVGEVVNERSLDIYPTSPGS